MVGDEAVKTGKTMTLSESGDPIIPPALPPSLPASSIFFSGFSTAISSSLSAAPFQRMLCMLLPGGESISKN